MNAQKVHALVLLFLLVISTVIVRYNADQVTVDVFWILPPMIAEQAVPPEAEAIFFLNGEEVDRCDMSVAEKGKMGCRLGLPRKNYERYRIGIVTRYPFFPYYWVLGEESWLRGGPDSPLIREIRVEGKTVFTNDDVENKRSPADARLLIYL